MQGVVGAKLKKARTDLGLSQEAFGRALGYSSEFISLLESDKRTPSLATLNKIATFLKKDMASFLEDKEPAFNILLRGVGVAGASSASEYVTYAPSTPYTDYVRASSAATPATSAVAPSATPSVSPHVLSDTARSTLQRFKRYCDDYLRLEDLASRSAGLRRRASTTSLRIPSRSASVPRPYPSSPYTRRLPLAPLYSHISPERLAVEERLRLGLGDEPIRDIFALAELNGCRILRLPIPASARLSGVFIFLEDKEAAFALINSADTPGRQAFTAAHEYCHYLKDRHEGPLIDNPGVFIDEAVPLSHPREEFAQAFAAAFLMPASKVRATVEKEFGGGKLLYEQVVYLKRYFGVSFAAMLRRVREMRYLSPARFEEFSRRNPELREKEVFGDLWEEGRGRRAAAGRAIYSDRYRLLWAEVGKTHQKRLR